MATLHVTTSSILSPLLARILPSAASTVPRTTTSRSRPLAQLLLTPFGFAVSTSIHLNVPGILDGIFESILRAVPKKKTSHMKKRHRQMAGKALKDVTELNRCSACGHIKRAHTLCPHCVSEIQGMWKRSDKAAEKQSSDMALEAPVDKQ